MLAVFIGLHLANHALALHSIAWHQWGMSGLRRLYRQPMAEAVLLLAVCWQVGSGGVLIRRRWARAASFFERVQGYSGLYLVLFLLVYVGAVLAGRYVWHVDTNFYFAAQGLNTAPWHWFFGPYYVLAVGAVFSHLAAAYYQHWGNRARARTEALWMMGAGWVLGLLLVLAFTNYFRGVLLPSALVNAFRQ